MLTRAALFSLNLDDSVTIQRPSTKHILNMMRRGLKAVSICLTILATQGTAWGFESLNFETPTHLGYQASEVSARFTIPPHSDPRYLLMEPSNVGQIDLFRSEKNGMLVPMTSYKKGGPLPLGVVPGRFLTLRLEPSEQSISVVAKIRSIHTLELGADLLTEGELIASLQRDALFSGGLFGIAIVCILLNILYWGRDRQRASLDFVVFGFFYLIQASLMSGRLDYWFPNDPPLSRFMIVNSSLLGIAGIQFSRSYLQTARLMPRVDRIHIAFMIPFALIGVFGLTPWMLTNSVVAGNAIDLVILSVCIMVMATAVRTWKIGFTPAKTFLFAWGLQSAAVILYFGSSYGLLPLGQWETTIILMGCALHTLTLTLGLTMRREAISSERAQETQKLRNLVQMTCHDLRNPLTAIVTRAQAHLLQGRSEWKEVLDAAKRQGSILDYISQTESIDSGKREIRLERLNLAEIVESVRPFFEEWLSNKGIDLEAQIPNDLFVYADRTLLTETVLGNLVSNAIKFSHPNGKVLLVAQSDGKNPRIAIVDNGIGIPGELLPTLFSPTRPTSRRGTADERGTGFGLPLVHHALQAMGGDIVLKPGPAGAGTEVWLTLSAPPRV